MILTEVKKTFENKFYLTWLLPSKYLSLNIKKIMKKTPYSISFAILILFRQSLLRERAGKKGVHMNRVLVISIWKRNKNCKKGQVLSVKTKSKSRFRLDSFIPFCCCCFVCLSKWAKNQHLHFFQTQMEPVYLCPNFLFACFN